MYVYTYKYVCLFCICMYVELDIQFYGAIHFLRKVCATDFMILYDVFLPYACWCTYVQVRDCTANLAKTFVKDIAFQLLSNFHHINFRE